MATINNNGPTVVKIAKHPHNLRPSAHQIVVASPSTSALPSPDLKMTGGSSAASSANLSVNAETENSIASDPHTKDFLIVFSDVDGTLVHYPATAKHKEAGQEQGPRKEKILKLPPSSTGMRGVISSKTLAQTQQLRRSGVKLVLVSGMRTSTLLKRLPFLPKADAYCSEAGGRIFYPVMTTAGEKEENCDATATRDTFLVTPQAYDGALKEEGDLTPFKIVEDLEWRRRMEQTAGSFGKMTLQEIAFHPDRVPAMHERDGLLWDFARDISSMGYVLDTDGYSTCFRVNLKQQKSASTTEFQALLNGGKCLPWPGIATSVNLANIDYYPKESGKKNCCQYLAEKFFPVYQREMIQFLSKHALCMCDDDNDLEMALACNHAYIPEVSSESMAQKIAENPDHFTQTGGVGALYSGTAATDAAIAAILERLVYHRIPKPDVINNSTTNVRLD